MRVLLLSLLFVTSSTVAADDIFDVAEKYNKKKNDVLSLESKHRGMLSEVYDLERKTRKIVEEKGLLKTKKVQLGISLKKTSKKIIEIENELKDMTPQLQKRLSYVHKIQGMPWMYAFLSSYSVAELDRMVKTFDNINKQEAKLTVAYFKKLDQLQKKKLHLKSIAVNMVNVNKVIAKKEDSIKQQHHRKKQILQNLESSIKRNKTELSKIKKKGKTLAKHSEFENLGLLFGTAFFDKKGELPHPVKANIKHGYGLNKVLLSDNVELLHKGHFYSAKKGQKVNVVDAGRVKVAQYIDGMGNVIVVDHGGRYYSVYSHLQKMKVKVNSLVDAGKIIATVGSSSLQFGEGLYFEIRHFSEPENPEKWLKKRNNQLAGL